jgi:hypothetical protein
MHGVRPILGPRSKLRYELRSAYLPLAVFTAALLVVGYCWHDIVTIVKVPSAARETQKVPCEATNRALLSASHNSQLTNEGSIPSPATKATATH